ncbi:terpene synthase family protein [Amycolatopsis thermoflava]|uniref:terpene synthase family protein n=1 Tax=Amycolatopsis thermoflava TaxID=84480 RepID=UPI003EC0D610
MTTVRLRPFYCPVESRIHPDVDLIEERAIAWLDRVRFYRDETERMRIVGTNSAEFYARFAPDGITENVEAAAHWVYWGFAFDDARCDSGEFARSPHEFLVMAGKAQRALENPWHPPPDGDPMVLALQDIGRTFAACATPVQVRRFAEAHRAWLFGVAWQIACRGRGRMPDLAEYTAIRLNSAGGPPTLAMLEIAAGQEVPAAEMDSPAVRALTEMTILVASWDNDLHSYRKEEDEGETGINLINVLRARHGLGAEEAVVRAYALRDRVMNRFLRLRSEVAAKPVSAALRTYLDGLGHAIRGNTDWALRVPRYHGYTGPGEDPRWADAPSDPCPDPVPIPAITWWWDSL